MAAENLFRLPLALNVANAATEVQIVDTAGSPDGVVVAPLGSLVASRTPAQLWQNTDGATSWTLVGFGSGVPNPMPTGYTLAAGDASEGHLVFKVISDWFDPAIDVPTLLLGRERSQAYQYADNQTVTATGPWAVAVCGPSLVVDVAAGGGGIAHAGSLLFSGGQATASTDGAHVVGGAVVIGGGAALVGGAFAGAMLVGGDVTVRGGPGRELGGDLTFVGGESTEGSGGGVTVRAGAGVGASPAVLKIQGSNYDSDTEPAGRIVLQVGPVGGKVLGPEHFDEYGPFSYLPAIIPGPAGVGGGKKTNTPSYPSAPGVWYNRLLKSAIQPSPNDSTWIVGEGFDGQIVLASFHVTSDLPFGEGAYIKLYSGPAGDQLLITLPLAAGDTVARATANDSGLVFASLDLFKIELNVDDLAAAELTSTLMVLS